MGLFSGRRFIVAAIGAALAISGCLGEGEEVARDAIDDPGAIEALSEESAEADGGGGSGGDDGTPPEDPSGLCANQSCHQI